MKSLEIGDSIVNITKFKHYEFGTTFRVIGFGDISHMGIYTSPTLGYCITQNSMWEYISDDDYKTNFIHIDKWYSERIKILRDKKIDNILS